MNARKEKYAKLKNYALTLLFPLGMYLVFAIVALTSGNENFFKGYIITGMMHDTVLNTIVALAIAIPLSGGRWDFGPGAIVMLGAIIGGNIGVHLGLQSFGILLCCIIACVILALIEATLYLTLRVPNMIISLGVVMIYEALGGLLFNGLGINFYAVDAMYLTQISKVNEVPYIYLLLVIVLLVVWFLLYRTKFGYDTRSLGANSRLAVNAGVKEQRNILLTYVLIGALLGCAAMLNACSAKVEPLNNLSSTALMFGSMAPVLIGLFFANFTNMAWGICIAALGMEVFSYGLNAFKIDSSIQTIVTGVVLALIMVYINDSAKLAALLNRFFGKKLKEG